MEIVGGSGLVVGSSMKRKRSIVSRRPRGNSDALFQSYFSLPSPFVEPFGKHDENENLRDTTGSSDGLGTENKLKKLKVKFGGVTRTIHTNSKTELASSGGPFVTDFYPCSDGSKLEDDADGNHAYPSDKRKGPKDQLQNFPITEFGLTAGDHSSRGKTSLESRTVNYELVRKSKRIPKKRALDVVFSDEDNEDAELQYLERLNASKVAVSRNKDNQGTRKEHGTFKLTVRGQIAGLRNYGTPGSSKDGKMKLKARKKCEDEDYVEEEDPFSDDESISERRKRKMGSVDLLVRAEQCTLSNSNLPVDSQNDVLSGSDANVIDVSDGKKGKLSEMEQQLKKSESVQRRKMQSEKAAREAEAEAIRKILGQDSGRKKKQEKMKKRWDQFAQEKSTKSNLGSNTIRWIIGSTGTVVTFSEDIGLPSIFQMVPNSYPPPRAKCAGPNCTNVYKYRDSKSRLPLCSLNCYKAIHEKVEPLIGC